MLWHGRPYMGCAEDKKLICGNGIGRENVEDWSPISNNFDPNERFIVPIDYCVHRNKCRGRGGVEK